MLTAALRSAFKVPSLLAAPWSAAPTMLCLICWYSRGMVTCEWLTKKRRNDETVWSHVGRVQGGAHGVMQQCSKGRQQTEGGQAVVAAESD